MTLTVLFDLDDTLLRTNMDRFLPGYFEVLSQTLSHLGSQERIIHQIQYAVQNMVSNQDPSKTLKEVFSKHFYAPLRTTEKACKQKLDYFYKEAYPHLKPITQSKPAARELVEWCQTLGITMAVATNPLFPRSATRQRIQWAGLDPNDFAFFSNYDDFHFTKPHLTYYAETLGRLGWPEGPVVMIGDNLTQDLLPMEIMGYETFWINQGQADFERAGGPLSKVKSWLIQVNQNDEHHLVDQIGVNLAILRSTPAIIDTWLRQALTDFPWNKSSEQDQQLINLLADLAYLENEVYLPIWHQLSIDPQMPLPALNEHFKPALSVNPLQKPQESALQFMKARQTSLMIIEQVEQKAFSATFSNTNHKYSPSFAEWIRFIAKHDRVMLRHLIKLLSIYKIN